MTNYVTALNNYYQGQNTIHLVSWVESSAGPPRQIKWTVQCKVSGEVKGTACISNSPDILTREKGTGVADSKSAAKEEAARLAIVALGIPV
ncbi:hypothetical protein C8F04DRAFT_1280543 [Mycena alexandri]|uniref:DRBM domain-containing protein n=1 Tax=Mycena alexandri TaxID=1745969 RepID=A0AAD6S0W3_9AGAR|nr:hypothetical protein C8F04DRAFT_1280543 [Mycena alexandri]